MELDDLKNSWKGDKDKQPTTPNIMELIRQKSHGPIASLQSAFRRQMITIAVMMMVICSVFARRVDNFSSNLLFWSYIGFCLSLIATFYFNLRLTRQMESMNENVKTNLETYVARLEQRLKWQRLLARAVIVFFILLLEIIPHYQHLRMLDKWHSLPAAARFASYGAYLVLQYFLSRSVMKRKFGAHLANLKQLLGEIR